MLEDRKAYETRLDEQLAKWKADLDVLKAKAARAEVDAKAGYDRTIEALDRKYTEAGHHLRELRGATDDAWENLKDHTEKAWEEIKAAFSKPS